MRCSKCQGTGFYNGMGMIREECDCEELKAKTVKLDKDSKAYKETINKIMRSNSCDREEATRIFDSEFDKIA